MFQGMVSDRLGHVFAGLSEWHVLGRTRHTCIHLHCWCLKLSELFIMNKNDFECWVSEHVLVRQVHVYRLYIYSL